MHTQVGDKSREKKEREIERERDRKKRKKNMNRRLSDCDSHSNGVGNAIHAAELSQKMECTWRSVAKLLEKKRKEREKNGTRSAI